MSSGSLTLTGLRFNVGTSYAASLTNQVSGVVTAVMANNGTGNATSLTINLPSLESGLYSVKARADPIG